MKEDLKMKLRKFPSVLCVLMLIISLLTPAMAAEPESKVIDLGEGFYVVETITQSYTTFAGNYAGGTKSATLYQGSTPIGKATLEATFDISGSTARAIGADISGSGQNGWGYKSGTTKLSGNKATGTAVFEMGSSTKSLIITLTCSPDGTLS